MVIGHEVGRDMLRPEPRLTISPESLWLARLGLTSQGKRVECVFEGKKKGSTHVLPSPRTSPTRPGKLAGASRSGR
ncbi:MAG: hypothetical protein JWN15_3420 [Firmicutes bacterium]|nr:hypothetical protein [Bacillota bacterium]